MAHIFCTKQIIPETLKELSDHGHTLEVWNDLELGPIDEQSLLNKTKDADALITMLSDKIDASFLKQNTQLKIIAQYAVGVNNIDLNTCSKLNIPVTNTPDVLTNATAEMALSLLLTSARKIPQAINNAKDGKWKGWEPMGFLGKSLQETKLGIIGAGRIGNEFAKMCRGAFNCDVYYHSRSYGGEKKMSVIDMFKNCDIISIHCPLTDETKDLINKDVLKYAKEDTILINTARGEVINQGDLICALNEGKFFAVGLDVTTPEPLDPKSELFKYDRVHIAPHIASATIEARTQMGNLVVKNILKVLQGEKPENVVNC